MQAMMQKAEQMQKKMQEEIALIRVDASAGGGMVTVHMDGKKNVTAVKIDPEVQTLVWPNGADFDPATLQYVGERDYDLSTGQPVVTGNAAILQRVAGIYRSPESMARARAILPS